ncbi:MAG: flagellar basal body P-ring formation protein FlgA [Bacteroidetes bacterium]|nr:flagellar basal body P-ring formation protein FlgA [Bacteroidota bacterium]
MAKRSTIAIFAALGTVLLSLAAVAGEGPAVVRAGEFKDAVRAYMAGKGTEEGEERELTFRSVPESLRVECASYALHVEPGGSARTRGATTFVIAVECRGKAVQRCMVTALIRTYADVVVANRMIPWRATPAPDDLRIVRMETTFFDRPIVQDPLSLSDKRARRIIAQGSILYQDLFEPVPLVMAGDRVNVRVKAGSVTLTAEGVAREDGHRGDLIDVSVRGRGERLKARVYDGRTVAVPVE